MYINEKAIFVHEKLTHHHPSLNKKFALHNASTGMVLFLCIINIVSFNRLKSHDLNFYFGKLKLDFG